MQGAPCVSNQQAKQWLNAAKLGETDTLGTLLQENPALLHFKGSGIGHAAVHWCAAKGHLTCLQWLLQQEADINCLNAEDSTPLHAAAANGQQDIVLFLLDQSATKVHVRDSSNETAQQVAETTSGDSTAAASVIREHGKAWLDAARYGKLHSMKGLLKASGKHKAELVAYSGAGTSYGLMGHTALHWAAAKGYAEAIDLAQHVNKLRGQAQSGWDMRSVRELLQLAGINMAALLERHEVMTACQHQLDRMPKPVGLALLRPFTCTPTGTSASPLASNALPAPSAPQDAHDARKAELSDDEDEGVWTQAAATAKQRGNEKYQRAEHQQAVQLYSMAINLQTEVALSGMAGTLSSAVNPLAVMYSNRSAANASLAHWNEAFEDAEACTTIAPDWSKGYCRMATALRSQGQTDQAVTAYRHALELDPSCKPALLALQKMAG
ncbi:hypothetical protein WJX82_004224 [Trebouxia sp. C0006]